MRNLMLAATFVSAITVMLYPGLKAPFGIPHPVAHIATFFALSVITILFLKLPTFPAATGLISLAFFLEIGQFVVPSRTPEITDIACNLIGVGMAFIIAKNLESVGSTG